VLPACVRATGCSTQGGAAAALPLLLSLVPPSAVPTTATAAAAAAAAAAAPCRFARFPHCRHLRTHACARRARTLATGATCSSGSRATRAPSSSTQPKCVRARVRVPGTEAAWMLLQVAAAASAACAHGRSAPAPWCPAALPITDAAPCAMMGGQRTCARSAAIEAGQEGRRCCMRSCLCTARTPHARLPSSACSTGSGLCCRTHCKRAHARRSRTCAYACVMQARGRLLARVCVW